MAYKRTKKPSPRLPLTGYCEACGKVRYMKRTDARKAADKLPHRMRAYRCPEDGQFWHLTSWQPQGRVAFYRNKEAVKEGE